MYILIAFCRNMELYKQKFYEKLQNVNGIMLSCTPLYNNMNCDHDFEMPIMVQVVSGKLPINYPRKSINVCVVLDRSGSMQKTIESCKKAIESLITKLDKNDLMSLVIYDDNIDVVFTNLTIENANQMIAKLQTVVARGNTDIYGGVSKGIDILQGQVEKQKLECMDKSMSSSLLSKIGSMIYSSVSKVEEEEIVVEPTHNVIPDDRTKILFLFSDGLANHGVTNGEEIGKMILKKSTDSIFVSTFGIGDEYDDVLMSSIAYCGKGDYFYIQNHNEIPQIVDKGLNSLTKHWTQNAKIELLAEDGVIVTDQLELPNLVSVREYALQRYLVKAKCSKPTGKIHFTLSFDDFEGVKRTKAVECVWNYSEEAKINLVADKHVKCFMIIRQCADLNKEVMTLMEYAYTNGNKIIDLKNKIIELYQGIVADDEYGIVAALLKKEQDALKIMQHQGTHSMAASKQAGYTTLSCGNKTKMYKYTDTTIPSNQNQGDVGFSSFM